MAKKAKRAIQRINVAQALQQQASGVGQKIEEFADDLGRLLGLARDKAEGWMGQRQTVSAHLAEIRDTAAELLTRIGGGDARASTSRGASTRRRAAGSTKRRSGRPRQAAASQDTPTVAAAPKKRTMSPEARRAISEAQKARWARQRRAGKTGR